MSCRSWAVATTCRLVNREHVVVENSDPKPELEGGNVPGAKSAEQLCQDFSMLNASTRQKN